MDTRLHEEKPDNILHNQTHRCGNCGHALSSTAQYCPICGQKSGTALVPLKTLVIEFFEAVFNIDSKFFRTVARLFIPGYLTKKFFEGKHVSYFRPLRLFFTTLLMLYALLGIIYLGKMQSTIDEDSGSLDYFAKKHAEELIDSAKQSIRYDTLAITQRAFIDSLSSELRSTSQLSDLKLRNSTHDTAAVHFTFEDIYELELDSIYNKYDITSFSGRLMTQQLIRATKEPGKAIQSVIANTSWMILVLMPVLAFLLKLLYIRSKKYYVEHLVFLFHYHAAVFVCMIVYVLLLKHLPEWLVIGIPLLCIAYLLLAMKSYYQQGWIKTFVKYTAFLFTYLLVLLMFVGLTVIVSLLIYK